MLRKVAEGVFQRLAADGRIFPAEAGDFALSMVRQWITNDGIATWFFGEEQVYFIHRHTPLGQPHLVTEQVRPGWFADLQRRWKIDPEEFPAIVEQLNRGQSAEVTNREGMQLLLWVKPKKRQNGVERVDAHPSQTPKHGRNPNFLELAFEELFTEFGSAVDKDELDALAASVTRQWEEFDGHACILLDRGQRLVIVMSKHENGCGVVRQREKGDHELRLLSEGFPAPAVPELIAHINLGQVIEFRNKEGVITQLRHNPKEKNFQIQPRDFSFPQARFKLGTVEVEPHASKVLRQSEQDVSCFLERHVAGDWGELSDKETFQNEYRLKQGEYVRSCYRTSRGETVVVCTTADRQKTVISSPTPMQWSV